MSEYQLYAEDFEDPNERRCGECGSRYPLEDMREVDADHWPGHWYCCTGCWDLFIEEALLDEEE